MVKTIFHFIGAPWGLHSGSWQPPDQSLAWFVGIPKPGTGVAPSTNSSLYSSLWGINWALIVLFLSYKPIWQKLGTSIWGTLQGIIYNQSVRRSVTILSSTCSPLRAIFSQFIASWFVNDEFPVLGGAIAHDIVSEKKNYCPLYDANEVNWLLWYFNP